jgi:hypothetical protein
VILEIGMMRMDQNGFPKCWNSFFPGEVLFPMMAPVKAFVRSVT